MAITAPRVASKAISQGWPEHLDVEGLFIDGGHRKIDLKISERVTILTGPNGSGKTRVLAILRSALALDLASLAAEPFTGLTLRFTNGRRFQVSRREATDDIELTVAVLGQRRKLFSSQVKLTIDPVAHLILPEWIVRVGEDIWEDSRDGELLDLDDLNARFHRRPRPTSDPVNWRISSGQPDLVAGLRNALGRAPVPTFIETKRLDVTSRKKRRSRFPQPVPRHERIHDYVDQIQSQVQQARAEYSRISQLTDSQFASRALQRTDDDPPSSPELRTRFSQLAVLHNELLTTGVVAESPSVDMRGGSLSIPERRMFAVFLEDWGNKLQPLLPVHEKLQMLQQIVGQKLTNKRLRLDDHGRLRIETAAGAQIPVNQLSSGEQHLLALFAMLLFDANRSSVVIIDEPEISLHAEWKHAFLDDIRRVAENADLQFVLATHSTGIINGQWDLVEKL